ncbi:MAG TPA: VWA domain-containing protein [Vicinamibacterales bacterium]|nr:VWA domain-containing protein [Vicinamibacterales bacterium]
MITGIDFSTLTFGNALYLWLLVVPAVLFVLWIVQVVRRRKDAQLYQQTRVLPMREHYSWSGDLAFWLALIVAAAFTIVALARPQARVTIVRKAGADIVILQDGSASMYVKDVKPDRWRRSIQFLRAFADALSWKGDRVALAIFAHTAAPQVRLTKDPNSFFFFLDHLSDHSPFRLEDTPTWDTNIETGIEWGVKLAQKDAELFGKSKNPKGFVVITDGQAWTGDVAVALAEARRRNIPVNVVGVGTVGGGMIPEPPRADGTIPPPTVHAILDRESLRQIAAAGGGEYFEIGHEPDREVAFQIIESVRRRAPAQVEAEAEVSREDLYWEFLFFAGVVLCLGTFVLKERTELWWQAAGAVVAVLLITSALR